MNLTAQATDFFILLASILISTYSLCPDNCILCEQPQPSCYLCADGYEINLFGNCVPNTQPSCAIYDSENRCYTCLPTYSITNGKCQKNYSGCQIESPNRQCFQCGFGLTLEGINCVGVINCLIYDGRECEQCWAGYELKQGLCVDRSERCEVVRQQDGVCSQCGDGSFMSGYLCILNQFKDQRCLIQANETYCALCRHKFTNENGICLTSSELISQNKQPIINFIIPNNCQQYSQVEKACIRCYAGYILLNSYTCKQVSSLCEGYNETTGDCLQCKYHLNLVDGRCLDEYCVKMDEEQCVECQRGYRMREFSFCEFIDMDCAVSLGGHCIQCRSNAYFINQKGICEIKPKGCQEVNYQTKQCIICSPQYTLNKMTKSCQQNITIQNCLIKNIQYKEKCIICSERYYSDEGYCRKVDDACDGYNWRDGKCLSCKNMKYRVQNGRCVDPNCELYFEMECKLCKSGFQYSESQRLCKSGEANCERMRETEEICEQCKNGYYLNAYFSCVKYPANCLQADKSGKCQRCANGYELSSRECLLISITNCQLVNLTSKICQKCQPGYILNSQKLCERSKPLDPNCILYNQDTCKKCSNKFFINKEGKCQPVSIFCQTYNQTNGFCLSCYTGYSLKNGSCEIMKQENRDQNCVELVEEVCLKCRARFYVGEDGRCAQVSPYCKNYDQRGSCTSCYPGYSLQAGKCLILKNQDPNCRIFSEDSTCKECYSNYYFNQIVRKCQSINPLCKGYNQSNGHCLDCYPGYELNSENGNCQIKTSDPYCKTAISNECSECFDKFYLNKDKKCQPVSPFCKTYNPQNGACLSCYQGYYIDSGMCVIPTNFIPNCQIYSGDSCLECHGDYFLKNNQCELINRLCKTFDRTTGDCTSCYQGYMVFESDCVIDTISDQNCKNSVNKYCIECYQGYIPIKGVCKVQDLLCLSINYQNGECLTCWQGYLLQDGSCVLKSLVVSQSDPNCAKEFDNECVQCSQGYILQESKCSKVTD